MPKYSKKKQRNASAPYSKPDADNFEMMDTHDDGPFIASPLAKSSKNKKGILLPSDPSPHDGLNQVEAENALLDAILPNIPTQGLSAPKPEMSRGALIRQQRLETKQMRNKIKELKEQRARMNGDVRNKSLQKNITNQIKEMEEEMEAKHAKELEEFDKKKSGPTSKLPQNGIDAKIDFKSINLNFSHIKFED